MDVVMREDAANGLLDEDLYLVILFQVKWLQTIDSRDKEI